MDIIAFVKKHSFLFDLLRTIYTFGAMITNLVVILLTQNMPKCKEILIIRPDNIGDFIIWLDTAKEFRDLYKYKGYKITLLCNHHCLELANKLQYFDSVIPLNLNKFKFNLFYRFAMLQDIRKHSYQKVIQVIYSRNFACDDSIIKVSGAVERIGVDGNLTNITEWQRKISDRYYTKLIRPTSSQLTELEFNAEFMKGLGLKEFEPTLPKLPNNILPANCLNIETSKYYVLFPGASLDYKKWPVENFFEIAVKIYNDKGWIGIICGGSEDSYLVKKMLKNRQLIPMIDMTGRTSILELASIIKDAATIITNDTSAVHLAIAVSTPSVCILGGGHYGRFLPIPSHIKGHAISCCASYKMDCFNCNWRCIYKTRAGEPFPCVKNVAVDEVWGKVSLIINT